MHADLRGEVNDVADTAVSFIRLKYCQYKQVGGMLGLKGIVAQYVFEYATLRGHDAAGLHLSHAAIPRGRGAEHGAAHGAESGRPGLEGEGA